MRTDDQAENPSDPDPLARHRRLREVFAVASDLPASARAEYLHTACTDAAMAAQVLRLLVAHDAASAFLEQPVVPAAAVDDSVMLGRRLGPYELISEIGRGGMGAVYLGRRSDGQYRKDVAVKVVPASLVAPETLRRFRQEQQILASLEHPNIARLLDAGSTAEGVPFVVMEFVAGEPIDVHCDRLQLPVAARLALFATVCDTVQYAHRNLVVHRDLKPSNILVADDGTVKLLDFGIAKLLDDQAAAPGTTRTGLFPMTPEYASPEQVTGQRVTTASDVYALGLLLYELLTGQRAHRLTTSSLDEIVRVVRDAEPDRPSVALAHLPAADQRAVAAARSTTADRLRRQLASELDHIVMAALRKEPERRYASVSALAADVRGYLTNRPVQARGEVWTYRTGKFARRHALPMAALALALVAVGAGLVATLWQARAAETARREAEVQRGQAERRLVDVRSLATSFVFEFHDAIANLAGATPARQLVVSKGLEYLDRLARESAQDRTLQFDLAEAYDRMGDIQGNPYGSNVGDAAAGLDSIQKAVTIREALAGAAAPLSPERQALGRSLLRLGQAYQAVGRSKDAVTAYQRVVVDGEAARGAGDTSVEMAERVAGAANRLCATLLALGDGPGAETNCRKSVHLYGALLQQQPANATLREATAGAGMSLASVLRLSGRGPEALQVSRPALGELKRLADERPADGRLRMQLATGLTQQGMVEVALGADADAVASHRDAVQLLDALLAADPANRRIHTLLGYLLLRRAPTLVKVGHTAEAAQSTIRGLNLLRATAERPTSGPNDWNDYASWLLTCEPVSLRRPADALRLATRAVATQAHPVYLDTLAMAQFQSGARAKAAATAEQALALLPPLGPGAVATGLRAEIEGHLNEFRRAAPPPP